MPEKLPSNNSEQRRERLKQALQLAPDGDACRRCLSQLADYIAAQLAGEDYLGRWPEVAVHLDGCPDCAESYARLYELEQMVVTERLPEPDGLPVPDLSFLLPEAIGPLSPAALRARLRRETLLEQLQTALQLAGRRVRLQLTPTLVPLLQPALRPTRTAGEAAELLLSLEREELAGVELPLSLVAYRDPARPDHCRLELTIQPPGRSWPDLAGIEVTLAGAGNPRQAATDAWGVVAFEAVPESSLGGLRVEFEV